MILTITLITAAFLAASFLFALFIGAWLRDEGQFENEFFSDLDMRDALRREEA